MRSALLTLTAALAVSLSCTQPAAAQFNAYGNMLHGPQQNPSLPSAVNPYLNLTMGGGPLGYQLRTLPAFQQQNFEAAVLQGTIPLGATGVGGQQQQQMLGQDFPTLGQTGHLSAYQAYGAFYNFGRQQQQPYYPLNPYQMRTLPR